MPATLTRDRVTLCGLVSRFATSPILVISCRVLVGGTLLLAGFGKLPNVWEIFIGLPDVLRILHVPEFAWQYIHLEWLPFIEIGVGTCLIAGFLVRPAAVVALAMATGFLIFNTVKLLFPTTDWCNCFGIILQLSPRVVQMMDAALMLMTLEIVLQRRVHWSVDHRLKNRWPRYPVWGEA